jgi:hypothetical protein
MKKVALLLSGCAFLLGTTAFASDAPRGRLLELHSCELYAGGCIVSSQATLGGRYMLRAWDFSGGKFAGTELRGLQLAVLQSSSENLAQPDSAPGQAVAYLPASATAAQRHALLAWLKASEPALKLVDTRVVPLQFSSRNSDYAFSAGNFVSVKAAPLETCQTGSCGEALWYSPRTTTSLFTVAVDRSSKVTEPLLKLKWEDAGQKSVFLARFGEEMPGKDLYVSTSELCGPAGKLF